MFTLLMATMLAQPATYPAQCGPPPPGWLTAVDRNRLAVVNNIFMHRDGSLRWNGSSVERSQVATYAHITSGMRPPPMLVLVIEDGASCEAVEAVRALIFQQGKCGDSHACLDGGGVPEFLPTMIPTAPPPPAPPPPRR